MQQTVKQLRQMSPEQLRKNLEDMQGELRQLRFLAGQGELKQVHKIRSLKKDIARIMTVLTDKDKTS